MACRGREQAELCGAGRTPNHAHGLGTSARTRGWCWLGRALRPSEPVCSGPAVVSTLQKKLMRGITSLEPGACHVYGTHISSGWFDDCSAAAGGKARLQRCPSKGGGCRRGEMCGASPLQHRGSRTLCGRMQAAGRLVGPTVNKEVLHQQTSLRKHQLGSGLHATGREGALPVGPCPGASPTRVFAPCPGPLPAVPSSRQGCCAPGRVAGVLPATRWHHDPAAGCPLSPAEPGGSREEAAGAGGIAPVSAATPSPGAAVSRIGRGHLPGSPVWVFPGLGLRKGDAEGGPCPHSSEQGQDRARWGDSSDPEAA